MLLNIFKRFSKKEIDDIKKSHGYEIKKVREETAYKVEEAEAKNLLFKRVFDLFPEGSIVGLGENKRNEELIIVETTYESLLNIYLIGKPYKAINNLPRIMCSISKDASTNGLHIKINDIQMVENNIGNGKIALNYLIKKAKKMKVKTISGTLSSVDADHFDRSQRYYENAGFQVLFDETRTSGSIKLVLE